MAGQVDDHDRTDVGEALIELGWRQGVLVASERLLEAAGGSGDMRSVVPVEPGTTLVIVSQTCDIKADANTEPAVEALICCVDPGRPYGSIVNSSRYFPVDSERQLVAFASRRVLIPKQALLTLAPDDWSWDSDLRNLFVRWLADRWQRAEFPDVLVEHFGKPLREALKKAKKRATEEWIIVDSQVYQFRAACRIEQPGAPLEVRLRALVKETTRPEHITTIHRFVGPYIDRANQVEGAPLQIDRLRSSTPAEFSLADAWEHRPLDFDYLSTEGEEVSLSAAGPD